MKDATFFPFQFERLSELSPAEQVVYVRLQLLSENGKARGRYEDLAKLAHVSVSTFRRAIHSLAARGLLEVHWRQKTPSLFILKEPTRVRVPQDPKWYEQLAPEDRDTFLGVKRSIPPAHLKELQREAQECNEDIDRLIFKQNFGGEYQRKYEHLLLEPGCAPRR